MFGASPLTPRRNGTIALKLKKAAKRVSGDPKVLNTEELKQKLCQAEHVKFGHNNLHINMITLHRRD